MNMIVESLDEISRGKTDQNARNGTRNGEDNHIVADFQGAEGDDCHYHLPEIVHDAARYADTDAGKAIGAFEQQHGQQAQSRACQTVHHHECIAKK